MGIRRESENISKKVPNKIRTIKNINFTFRFLSNSSQILDKLFIKNIKLELIFNIKQIKY